MTKPTQSADAEIAEKHLRDYAKSIRVDYGELMVAAARFLNDETYLCKGPELEGEDTPYWFWDAYQCVTGTVVPRKSKKNFFTCSC